MLATVGSDGLIGRSEKTPIITVRFPEDIWTPTTHPCEKRVREVEDVIKRHKQMGGEVIEYSEA